MSYDSQESSRESSRAVELYELTVGSEAFRYSSSEDPITFAGVTFTRRAIARDRIILRPGGPPPITVTLPADDDFVQRHSSTIPTRIPRCRIRRYQRGAADAVTIFNGAVASIGFEADFRAAKISVQSDLSSGNLSMPRYSHQIGCNHQLYGPGCKAVEIFVESTVAAIDGSTIDVAGLGAFVVPGAPRAREQPFQNGYVRPIGLDDVRTVYVQEGDRLTLLYPFANLAVGSRVRVSLGCDHTLIGDCLNVFKNPARYGGFFYQPRRNPFQVGAV